MIKENVYKRLLSPDIVKDDQVKIDIALLFEIYNRQSIYSTCLSPGQSITPHYHMKGNEIYYIISGGGIIRTKNNQANTTSKNKVRAGDIFKIEPNVIHQLENDSTEEQLFLLFICDPSHLSNDRYIVEDSF